MKPQVSEPSEKENILNASSLKKTDGINEHMKSLHISKGSHVANNTSSSYSSKPSQFFSFGQNFRVKKNSNQRKYSYQKQDRNSTNNHSSIGTVPTSQPPSFHDEASGERKLERAGSESTADSGNSTESAISSGSSTPSPPLLDEISFQRSLNAPHHQQAKVFESIPESTAYRSHRPNYRGGKKLFPNSQQTQSHQQQQRQQPPQSHSNSLPPMHLPFPIITMTTATQTGLLSGAAGATANDPYTLHLTEQDYHRSHNLNMERAQLFQSVKMDPEMLYLITSLSYQAKDHLYQQYQNLQQFYQDKRDFELNKIATSSSVVERCKEEEREGEDGEEPQRSEEMMR